MAAKSGPGRKLGITPARQKTICALLERGHTWKKSAHAAGISESTISLWRRRGAAELDRLQAGGEPDPKEAKYARFVIAANESRARFEASLLASISDAAVDDWRAAAWLLSRSNRPDWGTDVRQVDNTQNDSRGQVLEAIEQMKAGERLPVEHRGGDNV